MQITEGKSNKDEISFVEPLKLQDNELRIEYTGKLKGDEIKFHRKVGNIAEYDIVAKRVTETVPLVINIDAEGNISLGDDKSPLTADILKARLVERVQKDPDIQVAINADKASPFSKITIVMDAAKEAKVKKVNAVTKEAGK